MNATLDIKALGTTVTNGTTYTRYNVQVQEELDNGETKVSDFDVYSTPTEVVDDAYACAKEYGFTVVSHTIAVEV